MTNHQTGAGVIEAAIVVDPSTAISGYLQDSGEKVQKTGITRCANGIEA